MKSQLILTRWKQIMNERGSKNKRNMDWDFEKGDRQKSKQEMKGCEP